MVGMGMDPHPGPFALHVRPVAGPGAKSVADRILQLQRAEVRMRDLRMLAGEIAGERGRRAQMARPIDAPHLRIELIGGGGRETGDL